MKNGVKPIGTMVRLLIIIICKIGEVLEWLNRADCKSVVENGYVGSNPTLTTDKSKDLYFFNKQNRRMMNDLKKERKKDEGFDAWMKEQVQAADTTDASKSNNSPPKEKEFYINKQEFLSGTAKAFLILGLAAILIGMVTVFTGVVDGTVNLHRQFVGISFMLAGIMSTITAGVLPKEYIIQGKQKQ